MSDLEPIVKKREKLARKENHGTRKRPRDGPHKATGVKSYLRRRTRYTRLL
jgi:hypothetical protein